MCLAETRDAFQDRGDVLGVCRDKLMNKDKKVIIVEGNGEEDEFDSNAFNNSDNNIALLNSQLILCEKP